MTMNRIYIALAVIASACNYQQVTVEQAVQLMKETDAAARRHWDWHLVGNALPSQLLQLEGLLRVDPANIDLLLSATKAYSAYAYGWIEDEMERRMEEGALEEGEVLRLRAHRLHRRAQRYGNRLLAVVKRSEGGARDDARQSGANSTTFQLPRKQEATNPPTSSRRSLIYLWPAIAILGEVRTSSAPALEQKAIHRARMLLHRSLQEDLHAEGCTALVALASIEEANSQRSSKLHRLKLFREAQRECGAYSASVWLHQALFGPEASNDPAQARALLHHAIHLKNPRPSFRLSNLIVQRRARRALANL